MTGQLGGWLRGEDPVPEDESEIDVPLGDASADDAESGDD